MLKVLAVAATAKKLDGHTHPAAYGETLEDIKDAKDIKARSYQQPYAAAQNQFPSGPTLLPAQPVAAKGGSSE